MKLLRKAVLSAALAIFAVLPVKAAEINLSLAHSWPKGFPIFATSVDEFAALVEKMSDGRIAIKVDSRNKHKSAFGIFDFVKSGQYDIGQSASYYYGGKDPDTLFFTTMPFGMTALEQYAWLEDAKDTAGWDALRTEGCACASDAFFPFADGMLAAAAAGATAIIQPGGSIRDDEVIKAADEQGIAMVFTGMRHFRH